MILFLNDWKTHNTAIIDDKTTNVEFLRAAALLKHMKINNYYFHLALLQPELQGVDPYSSNLTTAQKTAIALECQNNPWYFFREIMRVPDGKLSVRFRVNRPTLMLLWCFFCGIDIALIMPRQNGKSVACDALELWLTYLYYFGTDLLLFTKDDALRKINIERIKKTAKLLPAWLLPVSKKDADNGEVITCVTRGNIIRTAVPQKAEYDANNVGRGWTVPYIHVDEGPAITNVHISLAALASGGDAVKENYEKNGTLYGNIYTTTAGKLDSKEGKYMYSFIFSGMAWNEKLYDSDDKYDARQTVITNSSENRCLVYGVFNHRQCGRTDEWLRRVISSVKRTKEEIERDYLNKWTNGLESSAIPTKLLEIIDASEVDPCFTSISVEKYIFRWYIEEHELETRFRLGHYVIGLDSSQAVGRDANAMVITDIRDMSVVATSTISEANLHKYAIWIAKFMIKFTNTTLIIENKVSGQSIVDVIATYLVAAGMDPFKRMYNSIVDNYKVQEDAYKEICKPIEYRDESIYNRYKKTIGFHTNGSNRTFLYDTVLNDAINSVGHLIKDKTLSSELKGLIIKNDRVDHIAGGHDDHVIAYLLTHWFVKHTTNLQHYGINPRDCLSLVSTDGATITEDELKTRQILLDLNNEIKVLKQNLISAPNMIDSLRMQKQLEYKVKEANELGDITMTLDSIMNEISEAKVSKRSLHRAVNNINSRKLGFISNSRMY